jgi:hypothetical protein
MNLEWHVFVGFAGMGLVLIAFLLLQLDRLKGDSLGYQLANLFGAIFFLVSLYYSPNLPAIVIQFAWIAISLYGIARGLRRRWQALRSKPQA